MSFRRRTTETIAQLQRQVDALVADRAASAASAPTPLEPPSPGTSLADLQDLVQSLAGRVDGLDGRQQSDHQRLSLRLEELTDQFRNQLTELSNELEAGHKQVGSQLAAQEQRLEELASRTGGAVSVDGDHLDNGGAGPTEEGAAWQHELIEELRSNQVRIANDLARHEIAFRQDLAALAELVNRSRRAG